MSSSANSGGDQSGRDPRRLGAAAHRGLRERLYPWWPMWLAAFCVFIAGAAVERMATSWSDQPHPLPYLVATAFGLLVGATELVSRYRDRPAAALGTPPGCVYVAVNGIVSLGTFWLLRNGQISLPTTSLLGSTLSQVLIAGFGSMALFRTSIFTLRVKDTDVAIGPAAVLQIILSAADRACDRLRAGARARRVQAIMRGVSFELASKALQLHLAALMQNLSQDEQTQLKQVIAALSAEPMNAEIKAYNLGLALMNLVGEDVLEEAVNVLGPQIRGPADDLPIILRNASHLQFAELRTLIEICLAIDPLQRSGRADAWLDVNEASVPGEADRNTIVLSRLHGFFGKDTVVTALERLEANRTPVEPVTRSLSLADLRQTPTAGAAG